MQTGDSGILRNMNNKGILSHPFIFVFLPCFSPAFTQHMVTLKERERQGIYLYVVPFRSLTHQQAEGSVLGAYQDVKYKPLS